MRVLLDECLPRRLAVALVGVEACTVPAAGWAGKTNGELLALADTGFDVFLTIDRNLVHQQSLDGRRLAVMVIVASSNRLDDLLPLVPAMLDMLSRIRPGEVMRVSG